ncbi:MAG: SAF domain-containing protein [Anaerolineales bacterium]|nr:SAF domain-containing protein [Anaerolineales bacterium]
MEKKQRSPIMVIGFALIVGVLVIALLNGTIRPTQVLVARTGLLPGTILTADLVEVRSVPAGGVPSNALRSIDEAQGQMLSVGRASGDFITQGVLGQASASGIPSQLEPGYVAMAVKVDLSSGVAGVLREGQNVTVIGLLPPDVINRSFERAPNLVADDGVTLESVPTPYVEGQVAGPTATPEATPTPQPPQAPLGRIAVTGLRVLLVPQQFRYQELPPNGDSNEQVFMAGNAATNNSVIVLAVPTTPVEIAPGMFVNPATLLAALNHYGTLHLALEPTDGARVEGVVTLNLGDLYEALNNDR